MKEKDFGKQFKRLSSKAYQKKKVIAAEQIFYKIQSRKIMNKCKQNKKGLASN